MILRPTRSESKAKRGIIRKLAMLEIMIMLIIRLRGSFSVSSP